MFFLEPTNKPSYFLLDPKTKGEVGSLFMREHSKYQSLEQSTSTRVLSVILGKIIPILLATVLANLEPELPFAG